jgi:hypothetical protein
MELLFQNCKALQGTFWIPCRPFQSDLAQVIGLLLWRRPLGQADRRMNVIGVEDPL